MPFFHFFTFFFRSPKKLTTWAVSTIVTTAFEDYKSHKLLPLNRAYLFVFFRFESLFTVFVMDYALSRFNMVEGQIKTNRVTDPYVLDAMTEVPREAFVPTSKKGIAYIDDAIEVARGRYMLEPMVLARILEAAELSEDDIVLDIGCNTGYSTAVLSKIVSTVVGLESDKDLADCATKTLEKLGVDNAGRGGKTSAI
jgi:hypothetical protein